MLMCTTYADYLTHCVKIDFSPERRQQIRFWISVYVVLTLSLLISHSLSSTTMFFILTKIHKNGVRKDMSVWYTFQETYIILDTTWGFLLSFVKLSTNISTTQNLCIIFHVFRQICIWRSRYLFMINKSSCQFYCL